MQFGRNESVLQAVVKAACSALKGCDTQIKTDPIFQRRSPCFLEGAIVCHCYSFHVFLTFCFIPLFLLFFIPFFFSSSFLTFFFPSFLLFSFRPSLFSSFRPSLFSSYLPSLRTFFFIPFFLQMLI